MRALIVFSAVALFFIGCNSEPLLPDSTESRETRGEPASCNDVDAYLRNLAPVLERWEEAVDAWLESDVLSTPPALTDTTSATEYLTDLSVTLAAWEGALETERGMDFLVTPPPFDVLTTPPDMYLTTVAPLLADWRNAIELWRGQAFLDAPPAFAEDTLAPTIFCANDTTVTATASEGVMVEFVVEATDLCDPDPEVTCDPPSGTVFPVGMTTVTCTATDDEGNTSECTFTVTVEGDTKLPTITCPADTTVACAGLEGTPVEFVVTAEYPDGTPLEVTCDPASGSLFPLGETLVSCSAADTLGNMVECSFSVTVIDTVAPVIDCPEDMLVECAPAEGIVVDFDVMAADACDSNVVVTSEPATGSVFPVGTTMVTATATDGSGNESSCTFSVTVEAAGDPEIGEVTASRDTLWPPNHQMVAIQVGAVIEDACGEVTCRIERVTSNEPVNGTGDGNTEPDWEITGEGTVELRAERSGNGSDRVYTLHVVCTDELGGTSAGSVDVIVPHDMR